MEDVLQAGESAEAKRFASFVATGGIAAAANIAAAEQRIREAVLGGERLDEARRKARYHSLQTRTSA